MSDKFGEVNKEKQGLAHITSHSISTMDKVYIKQTGDDIKQTEEKGQTKKDD